MPVKVGCCGFPRARSKYYDAFELVEVQKTFYKPPRLETARKWRAEAPSSFEFTLKAWQLITHHPSSPTYRKAGITVPPEERNRYGFFRPTDEHIADMRRFFGQMDRAGLTLVWEPRGEWEDSVIAELCAELGLIHCVDPFQRLPVTEGMGYFRLHGRTGYRYRYTQEDLRRLAEWCSRYDEVYVLFNNVSMWDDALAFRELIAG